MCVYTQNQATYVPDMYWVLTTGKTLSRILGNTNLENRPHNAWNMDSQWMSLDECLQKTEIPFNEHSFQKDNTNSSYNTKKSK